MTKKLFVFSFLPLLLTSCKGYTKTRNISFSEYKSRADSVENKSTRNRTSSVVKWGLSYTELDGTLARLKDSYGSSAVSLAFIGDTSYFTYTATRLPFSLSGFDSSSYYSSSYYALFGNGQFVVYRENSGELLVRSLSGNSWTLISDASKADISNLSLESKQSTGSLGSISFYKLSADYAPLGYFASYEANGSMVRVEITKDQYEQGYIDGRKNEEKSNLIPCYELGIDSENYLYDSMLFDQNKNRILDRKPYSTTSSNGSGQSYRFYGDGKIFFYHVEPYYLPEKDSRMRYHAYGNEVDRNSGDVKYYDNLKFVPTSDSELSKKTVKYSGEEYDVYSGTYFGFYRIKDDNTLGTELIVGKYDKKFDIDDNIRMDSLFSRKKTYVQGGIYFSSSNSPVFYATKEHTRRLENVTSINSRTKDRAVYTDKEGKMHECSPYEVGDNGSSGYDYVSTDLVNGYTVKANSSSTKYLLNNREEIDKKYWSYFTDFGIVISDEFIYPYGKPNGAVSHGTIQSLNSHAIETSSSSKSVLLSFTIKEATAETKSLNLVVSIQEESEK